MVKGKKTIKKDGAPKIVCQNPDCEKMGKYQSPDNFYKSRNLAFPHHPFCKDCVNKMIDINNLETVYDILKVLDTPFIMDVWNELYLSGSNNYIGDYLKTINFTKKRQYDGLRWNDSIFELSENGQKVADEVQKQLDDVPVWDDDWYGEYTKKDLDFLNNYLEKIKSEFKISSINHIDYARKVALASLAVNKAYNEMMAGQDKADIKYKNAVANFDMLSKSAKFAESTRSANDVSLGSFGKIFDLVEKHNWVPTYIPKDKDMYDKLLEQFATIQKSL
jgi:hypothetical protein